MATLVLVAAALWMLPAAADGTNLDPPENVEVYIIDDDFTLKWNSSHEPVENVTFSADYQTPEMNNWMKLPGCQHIVGTECDFSALQVNVYEDLKLRIRAEKGNSTSSWHEVDPFVPFIKAHIGAPGVRVEAEDKAIIIEISRPGRKDSSMWNQEVFGFQYYIVLWETSSGEEKQTETFDHRYKFFHLSPETSYCLRVTAKLFARAKLGNPSPEYCINTTVENKLPPPENINIDGKNEDCVVTWDYPYADITFQVQWTFAFSKWFPGNYADDWTPISGCENTQLTRCVFSKSNFSRGDFFLRIRATDGNNTSFWSEEKKFDFKTHIHLSPPNITVKSNRDALVLSISVPEDVDVLSNKYEVSFWENTSNTEKKIVQESREVTIPHLKPLTVYCVRARVHLGPLWQEKSAFSNVVCKATEAGNFSIMGIISGIIIAAVSVSIVFYAVKSLWRCFGYIFFPSSKPPSSIDEYLCETPSRNLLLSTSEEQIERCFVIEDAGAIVIEKTVNEPDDHKTYNSQTSEDSGNYSNEDENLESRTSAEFPEREAL
ncbi:interferon alpha/beta receptor 1 [Perognathus longimembris pacificus]|uniref:interferon alpha/beta receptor 1 n=1 Tax=Perognathus longimembris pacificus TaxID=214514 RepID=UPI002018A21E|nr:interferon alpha/beta receptor 1 [Perognathus longimembris pacificus]